MTSVGSFDIAEAFAFVKEIIIIIIIIVIIIENL